MHERRRMFGVEVCHRDRHRDRHLIEFDNQCRFARGLSFNHTVMIDCNQSRFINFERDAMGNIGDCSLIIGQRDNHAVNRILPGEFQLVGEYRQLSTYGRRWQ